jgi:YVTN family beta-propeller protein/autotransporter-associated beta strand protein
LAHVVLARRHRPAWLIGAALVAASVSVPLLAGGELHAQTGPFVYVPNQLDNTISVIDTPTNTTTSSAIAVGNAPEELAVRGDESLVYVSNINSGTVSVINTATDSVVTTVNVGSAPKGVAISPNGALVYVANALSDNVSVINTATNTVVTTIGVGTGPWGVAVSPNGTTAYVTNSASQTVSVINTTTNTVVATVGVGSQPTGVAVSPDGTRAYVTNLNSNTVSVINTATNAVVATVAVGNSPAGLTVSPNGSTLYVANSGNNTVSVINTTTNTVVATVGVGGGPIGVAFSPDGTRAYVTNGTNNTVSVINTTTDSIVATIAVGNFPLFPGACSNGNALLATGLTFKANTSGALSCTQASGPSGSPGPVFTGGTLQFAGAGIVSALPITLMAAGGTFDTNGNNATLSGAISGPGGLTKISAGTLALAGVSTYTGATTINGGTLEVDGSIANTSSVTVNSGGTLSGTGIVDPITTTIMSGGTLAPGNAANPTGTLTITGNLAFQSGALYVVQVTPAAAANVNVTGSATLTGGIVVAQFAPGGYVSKQYTILTASGGLSGTTFAGLTNINLPPGAIDFLSYGADNVYLNLATSYPSYTGLNTNQQNVANALTNYFDRTGGIPAAFLVSPGGLTQLDGEVAADAQFGAFQMTTQFLGFMLDPFVDGRFGSNGASGGQAIGFAPDEDQFLPPEVALAYASVLTKAAPAPPVPFVQRWTAWGTSYGGGNFTNGNTATGASNVTAQTYGFAGGMDYHYSPDTIFGFALGGGGLNWGLASGNGTGRSDTFQAGIYGITRAGPAYLAGSLAFANHWMTTNRAALGDQITASFAAQSYGGRLEGGYRFAVLPRLGVTPYGAVQAQDFHTPSYSETDLTGGGLGLNYAAMNATDVRTEIGSRLDSPTLIAGMPLILRGRVAWAHDFVGNPALGAVFESLPGANFTVNGAAIPHDSALTSAGAEMFITPRLTMLVKFDGEFAPTSQTYGGSGTLRYAW